MAELPSAKLFKINVNAEAIKEILAFFYQELERQKSEIGYINQKINELELNLSTKSINKKVDSFIEDVSRKLEFFKSNMQSLRESFANHERRVENQIEGAARKLSAKMDEKIADIDFPTMLIGKQQEAFEEEKQRRLVTEEQQKEEIEQLKKLLAGLQKSVDANRDSFEEKLHKAETELGEMKQAPVFQTQDARLVAPDPNLDPNISDSLGTAADDDGNDFNLNEKGEGENFAQRKLGRPNLPKIPLRANTASSQQSSSSRQSTGRQNSSRSSQDFQTIDRNVAIEGDEDEEMTGDVAHFKSRSGNTPLSGRTTLVMNKKFGRGVNEVRKAGGVENPDEIDTIKTLLEEQSERLGGLKLVDTTNPEIKKLVNDAVNEQTGREIMKLLQEVQMLKSQLIEAKQRMATKDELAVVVQEMNEDNLDTTSVGANPCRCLACGKPRTRVSKVGYDDTLAKMMNPAPEQITNSSRTTLLMTERPSTSSARIGGKRMYPSGSRQLKPNTVRY